MRAPGWGCARRDPREVGESAVSRRPHGVSRVARHVIARPHLVVVFETACGQQYSAPGADRRASALGLDDIAADEIATERFVADVAECLVWIDRGPAVLVGHSMGGLYMQLFARRYPGELAGVVLVDAVYPGVIRKPEDFPLLTRGAKWLFFRAP